MKKIILYSAVLAMVIASAVIAVSCQKEEKNNNSNETCVGADAVDDSTDIYLTNFKAKLSNSINSKEILTLDNFYWHLEALLNYSFGDAGHSISMINFDTLTYRNTLLTDEITLSEFNEVYTMLSKDVRKIYEKSNLPNKSILAIRIDHCYENSDFQAIVITRGLTRDLSNPTFDTTDYWNSGHDYGKCGSYSNEPVGQKSAVTQLTSYLNYRIPLYACAGHISPYFTNISCEHLDYRDEGFLVDSNSPCGYKIFVNERLCSDPYACLSPSEMNYYLNAGESVMWHYKPDDKVIVCLEYTWDVCDCLEVCPEAHFLVIAYGKLNCHTPSPDL